jgi:hypothetical protein
MLEEVKNELPAVFSPKDVIARVKKKYPQVPDVTIRCNVIGCSPNHPSSKHYLMPHKLFFYLGEGRFRVWKPADEEPPSRITPVGPTEEQTGDEGFTFGFEADLQDYLVKNLEDIEPGLKLYEEYAGTSGNQYVTDVGRIDILAKDHNGDFVVIELKRHGSDRSFGQLSRYMGWVKKHLAKDRNVRGVIIARKADDELKYAASINPNISIKEYEVTFTFKNASLEVE